MAKVKRSNEVGAVAEAAAESAAEDLIPGQDLEADGVPDDVAPLIARELKAERVRRERMAAYLGLELVTTVYRFTEESDSSSKKEIVGKFYTTSPELPDADDVGMRYGPGRFVLHVQTKKADGSNGEDFWLPMIRVGREYAEGGPNRVAGEEGLVGGALDNVPLHPHVAQTLRVMSELQKIQGGAAGDGIASQIRALNKTVEMLMDAQTNLVENLLRGGGTARALVPAHARGPEEAAHAERGGESESQYPTFGEFLDMAKMAMGLPRDAGLMEIFSKLTNATNGGGDAD